MNCDFPSDTGGDRKQIQWEATFLSKGCMRKEKWNKSGLIKKDRKGAALQKKRNTLWLREWEKGRNIQKRTKEKEREIQTLGQKVCLWCDSFLCRTRVSFCSNVCHQLGLVTRCECVCVCVCVCVSASESVLHIPLNLDKNSIQSFQAPSAAIGVFVNLSLTHTHTNTQASPHSYFFSLYIKDLFFSRTFSYIFISADTGWHHKQQ